MAQDSGDQSIQADSWQVGVAGPCGNGGRVHVGAGSKTTCKYCLQDLYARNSTGSCCTHACSELYVSAVAAAVAACVMYLLSGVDIISVDTQLCCLSSLN